MHDSGSYLCNLNNMTLDSYYMASCLPRVNSVTMLRMCRQHCYRLVNSHAAPVDWAHANGTIIITSRVLPRFYSRREIETEYFLCGTRASESPCHTP